MCVLLQRNPTNKKTVPLLGKVNLPSRPVTTVTTSRTKTKNEFFMTCKFCYILGQNEELRRKGQKKGMKSRMYAENTSQYRREGEKKQVEGRRKAWVIFFL